jgi:hypothetical protein
LEGSYHELLKKVVNNKLERDGYALYVEPRESPLEQLTWNYYRPDILGVSSSQSTLKIVIVECEINPSMRRMKGKISKLRRWFSLQKRLREEYYLRLLLVIPPLKLRRVNGSTVRRSWEIWTVNKKGAIIYTLPPLYKMLASYTFCS